MNAAPWSFSKIKAFQQCPKQFYHEKVVKQYPFKMTSAVRYGNEFHRAAEDYIQGEELDKRFEFARPVLDSLNAKQGEKLCEYRMGLTSRLEPCTFGANDVWFRGIADLLILDHVEQLAWVVDYKTGKSAQYADIGQLELMAMALLFVVCNELIRDSFIVSDSKKLWIKWADSFSDMQYAYDNDMWNPSPNGLCRNHCPVVECSHNGSNR